MLKNLPKWGWLDERYVDDYDDLLAELSKSGFDTSDFRIDRKHVRPTYVSGNSLTGEADYENQIERATFMARGEGKVAAVVTSPPYYDVTSFEEDQWLRLWFLGGPIRPKWHTVSYDDRHRDHEKYWTFLTEAWSSRWFGNGAFWCVASAPEG